MTPMKWNKERWKFLTHLGDGEMDSWFKVFLPHKVVSQWCGRPCRVETWQWKEWGTTGMHTYELPNWGLRNGYTSQVTAPRVKEKINVSVLLITSGSSSALPTSTRLLKTEKHNKVKSWLL